MRRPTRTAFTSVELLASLVVGALLAAMLAVAGNESRRLARLGEDIAKLAQVGRWTASYGSDNNDLYWTFSWKKGYNQSKYADLNAQAQFSDLEAAAAQAVDILRRVAGREDMTPINSWVPHVFYSHLPLEDYLGGFMPDPAFVSSADTNRIKWSRDPYGFDAGQYQPAPTGSAPGTNSGKRWPYSSSFQLPTAFYDQAPVGGRIGQAGTHNLYAIPGNASLGGMSVSGVAFASQKVQLHDDTGRHFRPRYSHAVFAEMRTPLLFCDGGVAVRASGEANPGWQPNTPASGVPTAYNYTPDQWEAPTLSGAASELVPTGRFRWTRGTASQNGLAGCDFGGPETCSGQPGCP